MGVYLGVPHDDYSALQGPAPSGFHVPLTTEWKAVYDIWTALGGGSSDGTNFGIALKLPLAGCRSYTSASAYSQGTTGLYWSSSRYTADIAYRIYFYSTAIDPQAYHYCSYGFSVRCFKDTPTIPTSSWTKLYGTSIEAGGIFWSSADGLISLSSDGDIWITIQDKNLGATTVWNSGDTLSEANCGKYYQQGNNYGFPRTGSVTTSSTQVDASTYGPGNYYSSSTFITRSSSPYGWDTTGNANLRGGVTGVVLVPTTELKNAYIGEYHDKYVYDFTTKTIADLTTDGWTNIDSNLAIDSNGIYNTGSGQKGPNYILGSSPSKLFTSKFYFRSTTVGSRTGTFTQYEGGPVDLGGTYYGLMTNSGYKLRWSGQYGSTSASDGITRSANTWYIGTHTVDLVNNTLTVTVATENAPDTALVTLNKDISSIIGNITPMDRIAIRLEKNYVRCKRVEVARS